VELNIPPTEEGDYAMDPNHLHIWPRHTFMMIALPNRDKSFTVTLFMPWSNFDGIKTEADLLEFFTSTFPDSIPLLGEKNLVHDYFKNPKGALVTIKVGRFYLVRTSTHPSRKSANRTIIETGSLFWETRPTLWCPFTDKE
jgi:kynurenine 3-monooxygenase